MSKVAQKQAPGARLMPEGGLSEQTAAAADADLEVGPAQPQRRPPPSMTGEQFASLFDKITTFVSLVTSSSLVLVALAGFSSLGDSGVDDFYFSLLCLTSIGIGGLLFVAEFNFGFIHRLIGLLKLRIGRAAAYSVLAIIGFLWASKDRGVSQRWPAFGQASLDVVAALLHLVGIVVLSKLDKARRQRGLTSALVMRQNADGSTVFTVD